MNLHIFQILIGTLTAFVIVVGVVFYFEGRFGRIETRMVIEFEDLRDQMATSADDLNYRLGLHRGMNGCQQEFE